MAKINYTIGKKIKNDEAQIILDIQPQRGVHYRIKTGIYITPSNFERLYKADKLTSYDCLYKIEKELIANMPCDKETAEQIIKRCKGEDDNLLSVFKDYADARMIERGLTEGTREIYNSLKALLTAYDPITSTKAINHSWLTGLITHMCGMGICNTTQGNYYRVLKTFMSYCVENEMMDASVLKFKPKFKTVDNEVVYLTAEELQQIYDVKIDNEKVSAIRDIFVVQCLTGLRYSDMIHIYKDNIQEDDGGKYITLVTRKTMKRLKIYFNERAEHILYLHNYTLPHPHLDLVNTYIPRICKMAGITGRVEIVRVVGSKRITEHKEKWEVIRSHTARRTFITLMLEAGENITTIRSITGHAQLSSFSRYVAVSDKKKSSAVKGLDW